MAMQVKHMLTVGLGLGVATALGYHFLSSPQYDAVSENPGQLAPLSRFELAPTPSAIAPLPTNLGSTSISKSTSILESTSSPESKSSPASTPILESVSSPESASIPKLALMTEPATIPTQPPVDHPFRSEATPLRTSTVDQAVSVDSDFSYKELVAAAQAVLPAASEPAELQQLSVESDNSDSDFSLDLSVPDSSDSGTPEFVFEEQGESLQQPDVDASSSSEMDLSFPETDAEAFEVASQFQDETKTVVVDYNSQVIDRSAGKDQKSGGIVWKKNPFLNEGPDTPGPVASATVKPVLTLDTTPDVKAELPSGTSVLSLNDPVHESVIAAADPIQTMSAAVIPNSIQPYQQTPVNNEQLATHSTQLAPTGQMAMNSADALKAVHHIEYGKTLSRRGAAHTARQEFLSAMQLIATANDKMSGDNQHTKALRSAMLAIKEAGDFSVASSEQQIQMDVASVVESHRSNVLTVAQAARLSPAQAMNRYFAKAQEQLDLAGGRNVVSAEVFYCMGKLHTMLSQYQKVLGPYETAQSVVYHQVALLSDNQHHRSANELGVLLARSGRLEQAKLLFERSLMSQPTIRTWQNLAEAHRRLGEVDFANQATHEVQMLASGQLPPGQSNIQWKPIDQFNADAPVEFNQRVAQLPSPPARTATSSEAPANEQAPPKTIAERLKRMF